MDQGCHILGFRGKLHCSLGCRTKASHKNKKLAKLVKTKAKGRDEKFNF